MKILYITTWDFINEQSDGVCKKIKSQIKVFAENGHEVDFIYVRGDEVWYRQADTEHCIGKVGKYKKTAAYMRMYKAVKHQKYDWVYNRYGMMDTFYYNVLKVLRHNGARVIVEIPTYPYIKEVPKGFLFSVMIFWDYIYLNRIKNCVDRIATYSEHDEIFGITTMKIINGVDFSAIRLKAKKIPNDFLDLIGVAHLSKWHGFDRVIEGLYEYYQNDSSTIKVRFHIVGDGDCLEEYKELVKKYSLENYVLFYGKRSGQELDNLYDNSDLAISSLALHRIGITSCASVLKSREYSAKGLPMISSIAIDIFPKESYRFIMYVPEDESAIEINRVIKFWESLSEGETDNRSAIREYAYQKCDQSIVLNPIIEYMKEEIDE